MNGREHLIAGVVAGPLVGGLLAGCANRQASFAECCGWIAGGLIGSKVPDLLESAYCPHHRRFCHSGCVFALNVAAVQSHKLQDIFED